ncbi:bifunctional diaminohydroxyphosphoribosylaminopyrimidine deaminase/5-amino-6-(5-phosphoribosylamino)uracil reductase RibD [Limibacter armeniacum]|uniref:bifunctional diaminohydroxyphosphoribosylaminopyrimidine deaminase/5-amino-6-(5-phosphoribosylamino)uracil reductase RibD n=1 Tax=Limibacter armeniacum TaxID=466084 RepID=UPI002FE5E64D
MVEKELYMRRALELAQLGRGNVSPNPMVGCVIVHNDTIIGEGYHQVCGQAHAEVNAIASVKDKSLLPESEMFVTLEPCSHHGKTPPCADLIVKHKLKKVYVCNLDPNPLVAGKGIQRLESNGIIVETGMLEEEGEDINARFFVYMRKQRPYIILKWAQTEDGFIARANYDSKWISNSMSRKQVHKWRAEEDAILVGTNTAYYDNPQLNVRSWSGPNPTRVVLDGNLRLPQEKLSLFDGDQATICYNFKESRQQDQLKLVKVSPNNWMEEMLADLREQKLQSLIVEGGAMLLKAFVEHKMWDEARIFIGKQYFGDGIPAPVLSGARLADERQVAGDRRLIYKNG